jgi:hypothetical protein
VHEPVEGDEAGERVAAHFADGRGDRAIQRPVAVHGVEEIVHDLPKLRVRNLPIVLAGLGLGWLQTAEQVRERSAQHGHVVDHVGQVEVCTRRRVVEVCRFDPVDKIADGGQDDGELFAGFHVIAPLACGPA